MKNLMLLLPLVASTSFANQKSTKVIYGDDNRVDVYESQNSMYVELSKSTAAMISSRDIIADGDTMVKLDGQTLEQRGMCSDERFSHQSTVANCSGFLVGDDLLVTAGHCITGQSACNKYSWVFDYKVENDTQSHVSVPADSVYSCKKIINRELSRWNKDDWALIQLDRKVKDRAPLKFRTSGKIAEGDELVVIGHPTGLPTKIADGATVKSLSGKFFSANLDTYGGNSGSAVFNATTGEVEGILVRGARDYVYDSTKGCQVSNVMGQDEGKGEDVTYITNIKELLDI